MSSQPRPCDRRTKTATSGRIDAPGAGARVGRAGAVALTASLLATAHAAPSLQIEPTLSVSQTLTDNVALAATGKTSDAISRIDAGLALRSRSGMVQGRLDYTLSELFYARQSDRNTHLNRLNAQFDAELVERQGFVNVSASVAQQAASAFAAQPGSDGVGGANATEVRNLRIAPRWQGQFAGAVSYVLSGNYNLSSTRDGGQGDARSSGLSLHLGNARSAALGWTLDAIHQHSAYASGRGTDSDRLLGGVNLQLRALDLQLSAQGGYERSNLVTTDTQGSSTWGAGAVWSPSPRTRVVGQVEHRPFGDTHLLSAEYRTPLTVWKLTDSRQLSTSGNQLGSGRAGTVFDLFFAQFASVEPDPIRRAELVNAFLQSYGIDPRAGLAPGFLSSAATVQDRLELSVAARGVRSSAVLTASRGSTRRADTLSAASDDLSGSSRIRADNLSLNLSHRLTPQASLNLSCGWLDSRGDQALQSNRQRSVLLTYSERLARNASWGLTLRRTLYETSLVPYAESALIGTFALRF